jgi:hypothetical protein
MKINYVRIHMPITEKLSKDINTISVLNSLWEKSLDKEKTAEDIENFIKANLDIAKDIINIAIPEYAKLLDKDELTPEEEWELIYIKDILTQLALFMSGVKNIFVAYHMSSIKEISSELFDEIHNIHLYLLDITGLLPKKDIKLEKQIKTSLKEKREGKIQPVEDVFKELNI